MRTVFSKSFIKAAKKFSGKIKKSLRDVIEEVEKADSIDELTDCKKLINYRYVYWLRMGDYRLFFIFHWDIENDLIVFEYLLPRGEAYGKKNKDNLRDKDL
ncbi:type II toxin-antitoxin system RelE family toxin [Bacteroides ihuae]|uniref:type II toxin-antitoxin system RelE family toxin n=1 Tax=Bacteroides ihuae TaxID=1852362 RepID=UPI0008D9A135|nr:hypothetical protein [Bacteroides ihuae]